MLRTTVLRYITTSFIVFFCFLSSYSQSIIKGKVIDKISREPLENAIVVDGEKGKAAITDQQGNFELRVPGTTDSLRVSLFGYQSQTLGLERSPHPYLLD